MPKTYKNNLQRLRKYFSGQTVIVPDMENNKIRLKSFDPTQGVFTPYGLDSRSRAGYTFSSFYTTKHTSQRIYLMQEYDLMETDSTISRALDVLSQETCLPDEYDEIITIDCDDAKIKTTLEHLFYEIMNIDYSLSMYVRQMLKYGDCFLYLNTQDRLGIVDIIPLSTMDVERIEDEKGTRFKVAGIFQNEIFEENIAHFRWAKNIELLPYGLSILEPVRRFWKQQRLLEDFSMVYYMLRSVDQRVFRVDVTGLSPKQVPAFVEQYRQMWKKAPLINPETNEYDLTYDPLTSLDDIILPVREGYNNTDFDELPASQATDIIQAIEFFQLKVRAGLGVPNFLLNYEEQINAKATASSEDARFAKTVSGIQKIIISELEKIAVVHLVLQGYSREEVLSFSLSLTPPSDQSEIEKLELLQARLDYAISARESGFFSEEHIYEHVFELSDDEVENMRAQILNNKINEKLNENIIQNTEFDADEVSSDEMTPTPSEPASGEGSRGGLTEPPSAPDTAQQDAPSMTAEEAINS
jgi:hypothetical protein